MRTLRALGGEVTSVAEHVRPPMNGQNLRFWLSMKPNDCRQLTFILRHVLCDLVGQY